MLSNIYHPKTANLAERCSVLKFLFASTLRKFSVLNLAYKSGESTYLVERVRNRATLFSVCGGVFIYPDTLSCTELREKELEPRRSPQVLHEACSGCR